MMAKGTFGTLLPATKDLDETFEMVQSGPVWYRDYSSSGGDGILTGMLERGNRREV